MFKFFSILYFLIISVQLFAVEVSPDTIRRDGQLTIEKKLGIVPAPLPDCLANASLPSASYQWQLPDSLVENNIGWSPIDFHMNTNGHGILAYVKVDRTAEVYIRWFNPCFLTRGGSLWSEPTRIYEAETYPYTVADPESGKPTEWTQILGIRNTKAFIDESGNATILLVTDSSSGIELPPESAPVITSIQLKSIRYNVRTGRWGAPEVLGSEPASAGFSQLNIVTNGNEFGVYWGTYSSIQYISHSPGGSWRLPSIIVNRSGDPAWAPVFAMNEDGHIIAVWGEGRYEGGSGRHELWYNFFAPTTGWGTPTRLVDTYAFEPSVAIEKSARALVTYTVVNNPGTDHERHTVMAKRYEPGRGWYMTEPLSSSGNDTSAQIVTDRDEAVSVLWMNFDEHLEDITTLPPNRTFVTNFNWDSGFTRPQEMFREAHHVIFPRISHMSLNRNILTLSNADELVSWPFRDPGTPIAVNCRRDSCVPQRRTLTETGEMSQIRWGSNKYGYTTAVWRATSPRIVNKDGIESGGEEGIYFNIFR